jgi:hypothetical protein
LKKDNGPAELFKKSNRRGILKFLSHSARLVPEKI